MAVTFGIWLLLFLYLPLEKPYLKIFLITILCFIIYIINSKIENHVKNGNNNLIYLITGLTSFIFGIFIFLKSIEPSISFLLEFLTQNVSRFIGKIFGIPIFFNPTAYGMDIFVLFLIFGIAAYFYLINKNLKSIIIYILSLLLINIAFVTIVHLLTTVLQNLITTIRINPMDLLILLFIFYSLPLFLYLKNRKFLSIEIRPFGFKKGWKILLAIFSCFILAFGMLFVKNISKEKENHNILIYNRGYLNWDKPEFGKYGLHFAGSGGEMKTSPLFKTSLCETIDKLDGKIAIDKFGEPPTSRPGKVCPMSAPTQTETCSPTYCGDVTTGCGIPTCTGSTCIVTCFGTCPSDPTCASTCANTCVPGACRQFNFVGTIYWYYNGYTGNNWLWIGNGCGIVQKSDGKVYQAFWDEDRWTEVCSNWATNGSWSGSRIRTPTTTGSDFKAGCWVGYIDGGFRIAEGYYYISSTSYTSTNYVNIYVLI